MPPEDQEEKPKKKLSDSLYIQPSWLAWNSFKEPDAIQLRIELDPPAYWAELVNKENEVTRQIRELAESLSSQKPLGDFFSAQKGMWEQCNLLNKRWAEINEISERLQASLMFSMPKFEFPEIPAAVTIIPEETLIQYDFKAIKSAAFDPYGLLNYRIAEELRRERQILFDMFEQVKRSTQFRDLDALLYEWDLAKEKAEKVHKRLCLIEKLTTSGTSDALIDSQVAELRIDHCRLDDALTQIGEIPVTELNGASETVLKTWRRLRLFSRKLKWIDDELKKLFSHLLR